MSAHLVGRVGVGPAVEQQAHHLEVAEPGGHEEARGSVLGEKRDGKKGWPGVVRKIESDRYSKWGRKGMHGRAVSWVGG